MTQKEIGYYIKCGMFSTEILEPKPEDNSLRWYYRDNKGKLHTGTATSRLTAFIAAEALGYDSME
jgi:hypothetical protein